MNDDNDFVEQLVEAVNASDSFLDEIGFLGLAHLEKIEAIPAVPAAITRENIPHREFRMRCLAIYEKRDGRRPTIEQWMALTGVSKPTAKRDIEIAETANHAGSFDAGDGSRHLGTVSIGALARAADRADLGGNRALTIDRPRSLLPDDLDDDYGDE